MADMTREEWLDKVKRTLAADNEKAGKPYDAPIQGQDNVHPYLMPLCYRQITGDMIRIFTSAVGDTNPLWTDEKYAARTCHKGIIAPPMCEVMIAETAPCPPPIEVPGVSTLNGGSRREYFAHIRPGDSFTAKDVFLGNEEKSRPGKPYRLYRERGQREIYNQKGELVVRITTTAMITARYPGDEAVKQEKKDFSNVKERFYSDEELEAIHAMYDDELAGKNRRGAETRYWEDVKAGDEIAPVALGPYDLSDAVSFFGVTGYSSAGASKWASIRGSKEGCRRDPKTNEYSMVPMWHFDKDLARIAGAPLAPIFGTQVEASLTHAITNWMGDEGELLDFSTSIRKMSFMGDTLVCGGAVTGKRVENGEHLVDLEVAAKDQLTGVPSTTAKAVVRLSSRR